MNKEQIMTPADVLKWAREASADHEVRWSEDDLQTVAFFFQFARLAYEAGAEAMKEECAKVCDKTAENFEEKERFRCIEMQSDAVMGAGQCADAIRARNQIKEGNNREN